MKRLRKIKLGNVKEYFLYAVSEILFVLVGILLALQINNWNEDRKAAENQSKFFSNLKIDEHRVFFERVFREHAGILSSSQLNVMFFQKKKERLNDF